MLTQMSPDPQRLSSHCQRRIDGGGGREEARIHHIEGWDDQAPGREDRAPPSPNPCPCVPCRIGAKASRRRTHASAPREADVVQQFLRACHETASDRAIAEPPPPEPMMTTSGHSAPPVRPSRLPGITLRRTQASEPGGSLCSSPWHVLVWSPQHWPLRCGLETGDDAPLIRTDHHSAGLVQLAAPVLEAAPRTDSPMRPSVL